MHYDYLGYLCPFLVAVNSLLRLTIAARVRRLIFEPFAAFSVKVPRLQSATDRVCLLLDHRTSVGHTLRFPGGRYIFSLDARGSFLPCVDHWSAGSGLFTFPFFRFCGVYFAP